MAANIRILKIIAHKIGIFRVLRAFLGNRPYRYLRSFVVEFVNFRRMRSVPYGRSTLERNLIRNYKNLSYQHGVLSQPLANRTLSEIRRSNFQCITEPLSAAHVDWFLVRNDSQTRYTIGVLEEQRERVIETLSLALREKPVYVTRVETKSQLFLGSMLTGSAAIRTAAVLRFGSFFSSEVSNFEVGLDYGCDIEFWCHDATKPGTVLAPRRNAAAQSIGMTDFKRAMLTVEGQKYPTISAFQRRMLDDVDFPIDAVYTWVDGDDPDWLNAKRQFEFPNQDNGYHPEANHKARFRSRDELKYSLRSLEMYAPWFRRIYLVTNGQVPKWLLKDHPKIQIVTHDEIYDDPTCLPTFNSNSIISRLHHIPGLSEHYIYINDDVFFGRPVSPNQFFLPSGIAKLSPSNNRRPFGDADVSDEPHINLTRNIRRLIEEEFGITISRAIKHTPHPQIRSVHLEMESRFLDEYQRTWRSRFRHHKDIVADQLFHYYAQITQRAVVGKLRYNYINVLDRTYEGTMMAMLRNRDRDVFCLNDAPVEGAAPIRDNLVLEFLERYFPVKSSYES